MTPPSSLTLSTHISAIVDPSYKEERESTERQNGTRAGNLPKWVSAY